MKQCWRWFGPDDIIPLDALHQVGATGVVTALHHIPPGYVWTVDAIQDRQRLIQDAGLTWEVVESLPVSEAIKTDTKDRVAHIDAYKDSLAALAQTGIQTVCYNFMPILDWTRTNLRAEQPHGGSAMLFDLIDFAAFDLFVLERKDADRDYDSHLFDLAKTHFEAMDDGDRQRMHQNITMGLPGANDSWTLADVRRLLGTYDGIDPETLRSHLIRFLQDVAPVAEDLGIRLCCHPDDPPFSLLGLPRIMSTTDDYETVLDAVDIPANGATFCTGSLGVSASFDAPEFVRRLGHRIHFVHLRNTKRLPGVDPLRPNFFEAAHLEGDTDMVATVNALMDEQARRFWEGRKDWQIPMRPDHGQELLSDRGGHSFPGYPLIGRMRGLAELRGIMAAWEASQKTS